MQITDFYTTKQSKSSKERPSILKALNEMPISNLAHIGDFEKPASMKNAADRKLVTAEKPVQKMKNAFSKTDYNFNLLFVNEKGAAKYVEQGKVDTNWLSVHLPTVLPAIKQDHMDLDNSITVIFTNNLAGGKSNGAMPLTPWIIVHRIGHAMFRMSGHGDNAMRNVAQQFDNQISRLFQEAYGVNPMANKYYSYNPDRDNEKMMLNFYRAIGTMNSARQQTLTRSGEFLHEMFAQYLIAGQVTFNPLPKSFPYKFVYGRASANVRLKDASKYDELNDWLEMIARDMASEFDGMLGRHIGDIFVI